MHSKHKIKKYSVVIVGSGVTGLSCAWHLFQSKIYNICLVTDPQKESSSLNSASLAFGGFFDNITRIHTTYGLENALNLWSFSHNAFNSLINFLEKNKIHHKRGSLLRLINSDHELKEAKEAIQLLSTSPYKESLYAPSDFPNISLGSEVIAVQSSKKKQSAYVDKKALLSTFKDYLNKIPVFKSTLKKIVNSTNGKNLYLADGTKIACDIVVLCHHLDIASLIPSLKDKLVPYCDQWLLLDLESKSYVHEAFDTTVFLAQHSYKWGVWFEKNKMQIGGARFLRPFAGIGATETENLEKINQYLIEQIKLNKLFKARPKKIEQKKSFIDIRPSDELPVIGPLYGDPRILLATGFMGQSLTLGFYAGYCLSQLIKKGSCSNLPRLLWPERFRTL